jgi:hypothetical protein
MNQGKHANTPCESIPVGAPMKTATLETVRL